MEPKAVTELSVKERAEYHSKIEKIKHDIFELEVSLREGQDARYELYQSRCNLAKIQDWYFKKIF